MKPRVGIELDDASHGRRDRQDRDEFVEAAFEVAGLPSCGFPASEPIVQTNGCRRLGLAWCPGRRPTLAAPCSRLWSASLPEVWRADGAENVVQGSADRAAVLRMPELSEVSRDRRMRKRACRSKRG